MSINLFPQADFKTLYVTYDIANASPAIVEQDITSKLENVFSGINDVKKISSLSSYRKAQVELEFDKHVDIDTKRFEVISLLRQIKDQLPNNLAFPTVSQEMNGNKDEEPFLIYTFNSNKSTDEIESEVNELIKKPLSQISGIKNITINGNTGSQIIVDFKREKLDAYHLELKDIVEKVNKGIQNYYPGSVLFNEKSLYIKVLPFNNINDIKELLLTNQGVVIRLKDIANIYYRDTPSSQFFRVNGHNAITLQIYSQKGVNTVDLSKTVKKKINEISGVATTDFSLHLSYDASDFLRLEINKNLQRTLFALLILTIFIFLTYRNWRHLLNLLLTLIVNLILTVLVVWALSINLHLYSLAGIAIAFGIMIDHGIVMLDYYRQFHNKKVFLALLGATLTTIAALSIALFLPYDERKDLTDFIVIICIALATSLFTNLFFTVGMYNLLHKKNANGDITISVKKIKIRIRIYQSYYRFIQKVNNFKGAFILLLVLLFGMPIFLIPEKIEGNQMYNNTLGSSLYQTNIRPITDQLLGGTFRIFKKNIIENSEYRDFSETKLFVYAELPAGSTSDQMNGIIMNVESYLLNTNGVDKVISNVYSGQFSKIEINFKKKFENGSLPYLLKAQLITMVEGLGGVSWSIVGVGQGFNMGNGNEVPKFKVKLMGYNYDVLEQQAFKLVEQLKSYTRIQKVNADETINYDERPGEEFYLTLNNGKFLNSGLAMNDVFNSLQEKTNPNNCCEIIITKKRFPIYFKESSSDSFNTWDLLNTTTPGNNIGGLKLGDFTTVDLKKTAGAIFKENRQYVRMVSFEYLGTEQYGTKYLDKELTTLRKVLPIGYTVQQEKNQWSWKESNKHYYLIVVLLISILCICAVLFEDLFQPLVIAITIPISFIGIFLIYGIGNFSFDQGGYASFIMVGGLVSNAGIFILNDFNNLKSNYSHNQRLIKAVFNRSRTIFLTIIASTCGVIPFITEGQQEFFWFSFAIGTIGGLLFSFFSIFIVLPVLMFKQTNTSI